MHNQIAPTRREFVRQTVIAGAALGSAAIASPAPAAAQELKPVAGKSQIRLGVRFGEQWLNSKNDDDLKFFKQIGVDWVDIELKLIKGYAEHGVFTKADLRAFIDRL